MTTTTNPLGVTVPTNPIEPVTPIAPISFNPTTPTAQPMAPAQINVTPDQTVQGQVKSIIDQNSPLMQQAETRSLQNMNTRGLINSSMAVGAGQAAVLDAAMPIASQDASTYAKNASDNAAFTNQFAMANNAQGYDITKNKLQQEQKFGYDTALTTMQNDSAKELANITAQYRNLTQASATMASLSNNAADHIHSIMVNEGLDAPAKQAAIDTYNANLNKSLMLSGAFAGDIDLSNMLNELLA